MTGKRNVLGRGLAALIPNAPRPAGVPGNQAGASAPATSGATSLPAGVPPAGGSPSSGGAALSAAPAREGLRTVGIEDHRFGDSETVVDSEQAGHGTASFSN